jgi:hypothetical protein
MFFLDSFWDEVGDQTEVIYNVHWDIIKKVDMKSRNINYVHLYGKLCCVLEYDLVKFFFLIVCDIIKKVDMKSRNINYVHLYGKLCCVLLFWCMIWLCSSF